MERSFGYFVVGFTTGVIFLMLLLWGSGATPNESYKQAYIDLKQGKLESTVLKRYPEVWVKYNVKVEDIK